MNATPIHKSARTNRTPPVSHRGQRSTQRRDRSFTLREGIVDGGEVGDVCCITHIHLQTLSHSLTLSHTHTQTGTQASRNQLGRQMAGARRMGRLICLCRLLIRVAHLAPGGVIGEITLIGSVTGTFAAECGLDQQL
ncbi:uncharacterized protein [Physcomitrium patens]|uniref:uncharacterized protein n=1 Tax=Physcomitrium patens TaxID=3218 RepID=UPI003CCD0C2F